MDADKTLGCNESEELLGRYLRYKDEECNHNQSDCVIE